ncbi:MAG TPA: FAD-dependent oxidoreductase [Spirochaetota bacterium]|nr:FAD-dependent oxidoreductase [Spirochaetota bacterium]HQO22020.1 FAD-dependent oxidoreductase [Spirochaetota bacterium]HQQ22746.1 FAD-dependent oxidoreductase [Spirochaetota bacterium]
MSKIIIIGGVAGGATAAARLRRIDENSEIIIIERGDYISYANCGLPYYIGGKIENRESLFVQTPDSFFKRFNVDVRIKSEALTIDREKKTITVKESSGKTYEENYDKLVLSPGAEPIRPMIDGIDDPAIFTLRSVPDTDKIKKYINENKPSSAIVIGGGFIGLEMAENLHALGIKVSIVEMADQVMTPVDFEIAAYAHHHIKTKGVDLFLGDGIASFSRSVNSVTARLNSGREIASDMIILSIGIKPDTAFLKSSGINLSDRGSIIVDEFLRTNDENIYAVGDAIIFTSPITDKPLPVFLAGPANKQGRIAANNIVFGNTEKYKGSIATAIAKVFDLTIASCGLSEKFLKSQSIKCKSSVTISASHATYYPGSTTMTIKLVFDPDNGRIFGAQITGYDNVESKINMIATVMGMNGTVTDLRNIEHAYAPPYSSAKDAVNIAGFTAENIVKGEVKTLSWNDVKNIYPSDWQIIDVRTPAEHELGSIMNSINIPIDSLRSRIDEVSKDKNILLYCAVGLRGYVALKILANKGFKNVYNLSGGYKLYSTASQKIEDGITQQWSGSDSGEIIREDKSKSFTVDACGLQCPGPVMRLKSEIEKLSSGDILIIKATDEGFMRDVGAWCLMTKNTLLSVDNDKGIVTARIQKGSKSSADSNKDGKTIVVFSDDLDKAIAAFVIANGAASTGKKVTMFFTFWGLNVIKKRKSKSKKDFFSKMFSFMMPRGSGELDLSKMNMAGMGSKMIRWRMKKKNIDSLEAMINSALMSNVEFMACQMSMDVMGVRKEDLIDGVTIGGVAAYLNETESSSLNLFI